MRVSPRLPDESVNVSDTHPLVEASTLIAGLAAIFIAIAIFIVFAVDILLRFVPPATEVRWLSGWVPEDIELQASSDEQRRLDALLARMSGHWETDYEFRVAIDEDAAPNALALPGGLIVVTRGLLNRVESENELAFVIGHELGHFADRDHIRQLGRATVFFLFITAVTSSSGSTDLGFAFSDLTLRSFNRKQEADADRFGLQLLHEEYGHVADSGQFFERIQVSSSVFDRYVGSHPVPRDRIDALRAEALRNGWPTDGPTVPWHTSTVEEPVDVITD